jgi:methionyl-tRNA formyltransferase
MRIIILVDDDHFFTPDFLAKALKKHGAEIVSIGIAKPISTIKHQLKNIRKELKHNIVIFGIMGCGKLFWQQCLKRLAADPKKDVFYSVQQVAQHYGVPLVMLHGINEPASLDQLRQLEPDIILSTQKYLFKKKLLNLPRMGCINKHAALLPEYRGVWPIFWALLHNEKEVGVSLHWMVEKYDAGGVITQAAIPILVEDTVFSLYKKAFSRLGEIFSECIAHLKENPKYQRNAGNESTAYYSFPKAEDVRELKKMGKRLI